MKRLVGGLKSGSLFIVATTTLCLGASVRQACGAEGPHAGAVGGAAGKQSPALRELAGAWRLTTDDDSPGKVPPPEVITFKADGTFQVTGNGEPFSGRFRLENDEVVMILVVDGNTRVRRRRYKVDEQGLHFANDNPGFAHYLRVKPEGR